MKYFVGHNINDLYKQLISEVSNSPEYIVKPRGMEVKEITNAVIELINPKDCLVTLKERKMNVAFSTIEKFQYVTGDSSPERLNFYNSNFSNWMNKYGYFDGDYGMRIHYWLDYVYRLLKFDPDSRQAVYTIYGVQDRHESKDVPCTIMHHFMIRDNKLNLTVYMRSNDLLWGFPYDVNAFCFIQELLAAALGIEMGTYTHVVGSLHIYTEREAELLKLLSAVELSLTTNPVIEKVVDLSAYLSQIRFLLFAEKIYRETGARDESIVSRLPKSLQQYFDILQRKVDKKNAAN